jgi:hypothetical protein
MLQEIVINMPAADLPPQTTSIITKELIGRRAEKSFTNGGSTKESPSRSTMVGV